MLSIAKYVRRAPKRRSCPPWAVPAGLRGMAIHPGFSPRPDRLGVGAERELDATAGYDFLLNGLECIGFAGRFPQMWNRSFGCAPPKSSAPGPR
eukprot:2035987-Pyramimonas_sp.AAC.1